MRKISLAFLLAATLAVPPLSAEVLQVPGEAGANASIRAPARGSTMAAVVREFGPATVKHPPVGGDRREQPRITRWDYPDFTVVFERDKVVDVVVHGAPMPIQNPDALEAASP